MTTAADTENDQMVNEKPDLQVRVGDRESWGSSVEFVLSLLGYAVGLTNVLRFPYVCMKNGGGAFLIPYFTCVLMCGIPLTFLEMVMGQSLKTSCIHCWETYSPICKGVGYGTALLSYICALFYHIVYAWMIYYFYQSFTWDLPWTSCNQTWNTPACVSTFHKNASETGNNHTGVGTNLTLKKVSAAEEFFHYKVLGISNGIDDMGSLSLHLLVCHIIAWVMICMCLIKGVKSVGKVIYVTATAPYFFIIVFVVRAALLPGSMDGILFFITPQFDRLGDPQIWIQAFIQVFFSLGLAWGGIMTMASYNKFDHPLYREAIAVPIISSCTSLMCGFLVFSVAGFLAQQTGTTVAEAISSGPGLAFVTYPEAAAHLPGAPIWAVLFFVMLIMTGVDSQFVTLETTISAINDEFKIKPRYQPIVVTLVSVVAMLFGFVLVTGAGMYIFQHFDWYFCLGVFIFAAVETTVCVWIYGHRRFFDDIEAMIGRKPPLRYVLIGQWGIVLPVLLVISLVWSLVMMTPPTYGDYSYPDWAPGLGIWYIVMFIIPVPVFAVYKVFTSPGQTFGQKMRLAVFGEMGAQPEKHVEEECFL